MLNRDYHEEDLSNINLITLDDRDHDDESDQLKKRILAENRNFQILFPNNFLNLQQQRPHYHDKYANFNKLIKQKHHRSSLGLAVYSSSFNNGNNCRNGNDIFPPNFHIGHSIWNRRDLETPQYGSMIDLSINGRRWIQRGMDNEGENPMDEDASNPRLHQSTMNNERIFSSAYVQQNDRQPFYANLDDLSTLEDDDYANFFINNNRSILSRNNSFLDLPTSKNIMEKPCFATDRFKQRLAACQLGLRELELLRNKHKHMIWQVKTQFMAPLMEGAAETKNSVPKCHDSTSITSSAFHHQTQRCHSPAPSSGDISNVSYRSSMSTDSGWMSMGATDHARHSSSDSNSTMQKSDNSLIAEEENHDINHHTYENLDFSGHPVSSYKAYCNVNLIDKLNKRLSKSYVCIENDNIERKQEAPPPPKPPFRYRRRGLQPPTDHHRPKSLYVYPNNQDAYNNYANLGYVTPLGNVYENSGAKIVNNNNNRRLSIAQAPDYRDHVTLTDRTPVFTWDEVKMMLENDFASKAGTPSFPNHHCCVRPPIPAAVARLQASCRPLVSRSMSVQSVEGSSKYKRCREKMWRESDCL